MNYTINFRGHNLIIEKLPNGKFKIPEEIKKLSGSYGGAQFKPAWETILVAMKPITEKTYVDQALKNGKGITWLDDCRVPCSSPEDAASATPQGRVTSKASGAIGASPDAGRELDRNEFERPDVSKGRFPANLLVSDDVLNDGRTSKSTASKWKGLSGNGSNEGWKRESHTKDIEGEFNDSGSYSRYFDLDKWANTLPFLITPKASKSEKNKGLDDMEVKQVKGGGGGIGDYLDDVNSAGGKYGSEKTPAKNFHPTCKPLKLMSYLITLGSRKGDIVLDPFCGSGTTCLASKNLERNYIGIEREEEYVKIAEARLI